MTSHDPCVDGSGVIQGLDEAALDIYSRYVVPPQGIYGVGATVVPTVPWPEWHWWSHLEVDSVTVAAGSGNPALMLTVPTNERHRFQGLYVLRNSGDNTAAGLTIVYPEGYGTGSRTTLLQLIATPSDELNYPVVGSVDAGQEPRHQLWGGPFTMEPGTLLRLAPGGVGVAESVFTFHIMLEKSRLIRARVPT